MQPDMPSHIGNCMVCMYVNIVTMSMFRHSQGGPKSKPLSNCQ